MHQDSPVVASSANLLEKECTELQEFSNLKTCSVIELHESENIETGEKSIEAPPFSPLTPLLTKKRFVAGPYTSPAIASPGDDLKINDAVATSPGDGLKVNDAMLACENNYLSSGASSPLPPMSPETAELFKTLNSNGLDYDSDDSVADPNYTAINDSSSSSSVDSTKNLNREQRNYIEITQNQNDPNDAPIAEMATINDIASTSTDIDVQTNENLEGRQRKGRKRKYGGLSRKERTEKKYKNLPYVNTKNVLIEPKKFLDYDCSCIRKCKELVPVEKRLKEFQKFYELGSYNAQSMYLAACVKEQPVKRSYVSTNTSNISKKKKYSRLYFLQGIQVCRDMFIKTLQTTPKRVNTSLCKMRSDDGLVDRRGTQGGHNKISPDVELFLINIIKKLPKYVSHYRRNEYGDAKFLKPDMTFPKVYRLYCEEAQAAGIPSVSYDKAKQVFLTKFNLRTKKLKKDTCNRCDSFHNKIKEVSEEDKHQIALDHDTHLQLAKSLQNLMKSDLCLAKNDPFIETITFDLQKTLPLPRIPTNIVFYKRQLWVYNLGVHTGTNDQAYCYVWVEGEAGRGSQEVGSCLLKHTFENLKPNVKKLILWSDSCGGQNRNIKLVLILKALLNDHPSLEEISFRFLESGHSFLPNDNDFAKIECALKLHQRIYLPEDYIHIMKHCKKNKPLQVHRMENTDFVTSSELESIITNRKKAVDGTKVSWLKTKEIVLKKNEMFTIYMRSSYEEEFKEVNIKKNSRGRQKHITKLLLKPMWPTGKAIPGPKLKDLKSLLHLIPNDAKGFYQTLTSDENILDDVDGFSGEIDFQIETDTLVSDEENVD